MALVTTTDWDCPELIIEAPTTLRLVDGSATVEVLHTIVASGVEVTHRSQSGLADDLASERCTWCARELVLVKGQPKRRVISGPHRRFHQRVLVDGQQRSWAYDDAVFSRLLDLVEAVGSVDKLAGVDLVVEPVRVRYGQGRTELQVRLAEPEPSEPEPSEAAPV